MERTKDEMICVRMIFGVLGLLMREARCCLREAGERDGGYAK